MTWQTLDYLVKMNIWFHFIRKWFPWKQKHELLRNQFFGDYASLQGTSLPQTMLGKLKSCK